MVDEAAAASAASTCSSTTPASSTHPIAETTYEEWQAAWARHAGREPRRRGQRHLVRGAAHAAPARPDRQRLLARRLPRRARPPAYGASKAGLIAFGQSLARALGPHGISVASVAPGFTETDMAAEELAGPRGDARRAESPFGRVATPEEVAAAVLFLASPEAAFASGAVLDVNGASYLRM